MTYVQTELGCAGKRLKTLLPQDKRVKVGSLLTLVKEPGIWKVLQQYGTVESSSINRGWNNNI